MDELQVLFETGKLDDASARKLSSDFYTVIPHPIGRSKADVMASVLKTPEAFEQKRELLQIMKDMVQINSSNGGVLSRYATTSTQSPTPVFIKATFSVDDKFILC